MDQSDDHNRIARELFLTFANKTFREGMETTQVMVIMESVLVGVFLVAMREDGDEKVLDLMLQGTKTRVLEKLGPLREQFSKLEQAHDEWKDFNNA